MKKIMYLLLLSIAFSPNYAQHPTGSHAYRIDDKIVKQQVVLGLDRDCRQDMVWDLSDMEELDNRHKVCYTEVYDKPLQVAGIENNTRHYYEQRGDSLLTWGYENNLTTGNRGLIDPISSTIQDKYTTNENTRTG